MFEYELQKFREGYDYIIGCDEVGRGALAGPVIAAAVMFDVNHIAAAADTWKRNVKDSKLLSARKREELSEKIFNAALHVEFGEIGNEEIDSDNIHTATLSAMREGISKIMLVKQNLKQKIFVCVDGKFFPKNLECKYEAIVDGDTKVFSISAASIVAKVFRDNLMVKHAKRFPEYGFDKHKGYGTKTHIAAVKQHGTSVLHRKTFCKAFV